MAARRSYTAGFKLNVVAYAKEMGNRAAGNLFCVNEKQIRYWKKQEDLLRVSHKSKRANRGGAARWSLLEDLLEAWVLEQVAAGWTRLSTRHIQQKAWAIAREKNIQGFVGGASWCFRFLRRKKLVFVNCRGRKKIQQSPTPETSDKKDEDNNLHSMLSTSNQMVKSPETTMGPMDLLLPPNFETDALEQTDFAVSNDIENVEEMKEEIQEDPIDCQMQQIMVNENQSPEMIHQGVPDSVIMETYQPSSKRLLVVPEHQYSMMSSLALMWKKQKMCDASIGNGTTIIMVHKVVLLAISPTLLSSSEVRNNCFLRVNFPANISENAMRAFAEYMYNGVLDLDPLTLTQLQQISYQLGIEDLRLLCESHLCSQTTQVSSSSIDNMLYPGTSLPPHLTTQSDSSSVQRKYSSSTEIKKKSLMSTSWQQSGQDFVSHGPVIIKTEPEDAVPDYPIMQTHPTRSTTTARSVSKMTHSQGSSVTKSSKTLKTFQEPSRTVTVESQHVSHIKLEPVEHSESEHDQHRRTLSSNTSTSNCPPTKIDPSPRATSNCSNSIKLTSGNSSYQSKFARNQTKNVTATQRLPSPGSKVVPLSRDESNMIALDGNNCFNNSTVRSKSNTSDMPYPVMLFSSELETLPLNVSKTVTKAEHYVDLTSS